MGGFPESVWLRPYVVLLLLITQCIAMAAAQANQADQTAAQSIHKPAPLPTPLPEPLTLEYALSLADATHPALLSSEAGIKQARAGELAADALDGTNISLQSQLRYVEPPDYSTDPTNDDHSLELIINKNLYDFGRSSGARDAASAQIKSSKYLYEDTRQKQYIDVMRRYFEVVLADMQFYRYNEEMAVEFISLDRLRDKKELGQVSDIDLMEQESQYQKTRHLRFQSQNEQRATRARLALALNRPGQLPDTVAVPKLKLDRKLPEVEEMQAQAENHSQRLLAMRAKVQASQARLAAARSQDSPVLNGSVKGGTYSRERTSYDDWRAELTLSIPLSTGGSTDAAVANEQATLYNLQAEYQQSRLTVQQQVLELWLQLDALRSKREQTIAEKDFRELYLDRSRALYELEVKADLGDAMVRVSEAEREAMSTDFQIALAWAQLDALTGQMLNKVAGQTEDIKPATLDQKTEAEEPEQQTAIQNDSESSPVNTDGANNR